MKPIDPHGAGGGVKNRHPTIFLKHWSIKYKKRLRPGIFLQNFEAPIQNFWKKFSKTYPLDFHPLCNYDVTSNVLF